MPSMFDPTDNNALVERINKLTPQTPAAWGKMNVSQMLAHCVQPLKNAFGEIRLKQGLVGLLFGKMAKKKFVKGEPFSKSLPTAREFVIAGTPDFEQEKVRVISLLKRFISEGPTALTNETHPFFGKMTTDEWDKLIWQHLDHHLRQFSV